MAYNLVAATAKIRADAKKYGIDPEIAVKVARSEGLGGGIYQSNVMKNGMREPSYGPFQLLVGDGENFPKGMGNDFMAQTGLDPRDPDTVDAQIDFALAHAAKNGWGSWFGAKAAGIGNRQGIPGGSATAYASEPEKTGAAAAIDRNFDGGARTITSVPMDNPAAAEAVSYDPAGPKQSRRIGGLGGLGGFDPGPEPQPINSVGDFLRSDGFGDFLSAAGSALIAGDGKVFAQTLDQRQDNRLRREAQDYSRHWGEYTFGKQMEAKQRDDDRQDDEFKYRKEHDAAVLKAAERNGSNMTADMQNFQYMLSNPEFAEYLKTKNGGRGGNSGPTAPGGGAMPSGFRNDPNNPDAITPIPGGPGDQISSELAARLGLVDNFLSQAPGLRGQLEKGDATGPIDRFMAGNAASSDQAQLFRQLQSGTDALMRMLTGAGMNKEEAASYANRYLPGYTDDAASSVKKLDQLTGELERVKGVAMRGRGGSTSRSGGGTDYKTKYGLD